MLACSSSAAMSDKIGINSSSLAETLHENPSIL